MNQNSNLLKLLHWGLFYRLLGAFSPLYFSDFIKVTPRSIEAGGEGQVGWADRAGR